MVNYLKVKSSTNTQGDKVAQLKSADPSHVVRDPKEPEEDERNKKTEPSRVRRSRE